MVERLTEAENLVWRMFPSGEWADLRTGEPGADDVAGGASWGLKRTVRAEVIRALLLGAGDHAPGRHPAVRLRGARVTGRLDLMGAAVAYALICEGCYFEEPLRFVEATTKTIRVAGSRLPTFDGARIRTDGVLNFSQSRIAHGVRLDRAKVTGEVTLRGAIVEGDAEGVAIAADGLTVDGNLECGTGFTAEGMVRVRGARLTGVMDLSESRLNNPGAAALDASNLVVEGWLAATRAVVAGEFGLTNARVTGWVDISGARLRNPGRIAFAAGGMNAGGLWCHHDCVAEGEIRLVGARLDDNLTVAGATLSNPGGTALNLNRCTVGDLEAAELTVNGGHVRLVGAKIASQVNLKRAKLDDGADGTALIADGINAGTLMLDEMRANGAVVIRTARISGRVNLVRSRLVSSGTALRLSRTEVGADVYLTKMSAEGRVKLTGARIGRHLSLRAARLTNPGGVALDVRSLTAGQMTLGGPVQGSVELRHARIGVLRDDPGNWPSGLYLDGLTYETLEPRLPAKERLTWLARDLDGFIPQPYEQLAAYYTRIGQPGEARRVLYARELRQRETKNWIGRIWSFLQDATVGYGYRSRRAVLWLILLVVIGSILYGLTPPQPLKAGESPHFNPVIYTLDLLLPIVDLGQRNAFNPAGIEQWFSYFLVAAGWILATTVATGIARVTTRR